MNYKIDNKIIYHEENGRLFSITEPENTIRLSITPARILSYLLENKYRVINRDEILEKVWDEYGLQASNNSLSQHISLLRKALQELGYTEDIIVTVPKVGFKISENIVIEAESTTSQEEDNLEEDSHDNEIMPIQKSKVHVISYVLLVILLVASALLTTLLIQFIEKENTTIIAKAELYPIGNIGQCPAFTLEKNSDELTAANLQLATEFANKNLPCIDNYIYIFQSDDNYIHSHSGRVFLSRCMLLKSHNPSFSGCQDVYTHEY
ncbi:transcriptional regulator [Yersinia sp. HM-2024]|uniref:winged helix-turn-helix domain-containing protein n=1 Tax=Yersinia sp. HM-2024 TaxID=3344550 RepID=UPI00370D2CE3